jgi:O-antigen/teichoic acid export membrane protein
MLLSGAVSTIVIWWQAEAMRRGAGWARAQIRRYLTATGGATVVLSVMALVPVSLVLARVTGLGFGEVAVITAWLFTSIVGFVVLMGFVHLFAASGTVRIVGWLSLGNAITNIAGNLLLVPPFGLSGAAAATALSQCLTATAAYFAARRWVGLDAG